MVYYSFKNRCKNSSLNGIDNPKADYFFMSGILYKMNTFLDYFLEFSYCSKSLLYICNCDSFFWHFNKTQRLKIYKNLSSFKSDKKTVLTTGTFDGVHLGHQKILKRLVQSAQEMNAESVLFTFNPHPRMILYPDDHGLRLLTSPDEKSKILNDLGVDHLIEYPFSKEFSKMSARSYVRKILVGKIGISKIIIGYDHRFGNHREGNYNKLLEFGEIYNFKIEQITALEMEEIKISSTKIRNALLSGELDVASKYLGRNYEVNGKVVGGKKIGSKIGFPTANILPDYEWKLIPSNGVYAVNCYFEDKKVAGILNIGTRPTVNESDDISIEVHLLGWDGLIYDVDIKVEFLYKIRDEKKFDSLEELKNQIELDKQLVINKG